MKQFIFSFIVVLFTFYCNTGVSKDWKPISIEPDKLKVIKVRLGEEKEQVFLSSTGNISIVSNNETKTLGQSTAIYKPKEKVSLTSSKGEFNYKANVYRGELEVVPIENDKLLIVNKLPLEEYLLGVVPSEMPPSWPLEALKSQAICARSYAIYSMLNSQNNHFNIRDDVFDQAYRGKKAETDNSSKAVKETENMIILYNEKPVPAYYHSNAGGITEDPVNIWGDKLNYLESVPSQFDYFASNFSWKFQLEKSTIESKLKEFDLGEIKDIVPNKFTHAGRVIALEIQGTNKNYTIKGTEFRKLIGYDKIRSLKFYIDKSDNIYTISGYGYGHGIGMSQWGSYGMAKANYSYAEILNHYYKDISIVKISFNGE